MAYHEKAIVYTSDDKGQGKATYWQDDNGKVTKKTKKITSPEQIDKLYKELGFDQVPDLDTEKFFDFSLSSPFRWLDDLSENFFGRRSMPILREPVEGSLPEGVDVGKHRDRLRELQQKKRQEEADMQQKEEQKRYLQQQIEELKEIKKQLKDGGDEEGSKQVDGDIEKLQQHLKEMK